MFNYDKSEIQTYMFHIPSGVLHRVDCQIDNTGDDDDNDECWRDIFPTNPPVHVRPKANHILNVIFKSVKKCLKYSKALYKPQSEEIIIKNKIKQNKISIQKFKYK